MIAASGFYISGWFWFWLIVAGILSVTVIGGLLWLIVRGVAKAWRKRK